MSDGVTEKIDKIQPILLSISKELSNLYSSGKDLAQQELPILAKEITRYGISHSFLWAFLGVAMFSAAFYGSRKLYKSDEKEEDRIPDDAVGTVLCILALTFIASLVLIFYNLDTMAMALFSPRFYLLKEAASLIK
jgi:hypothetical protein